MEYANLLWEGINEQYAFKKEINQWRVVIDWGAIPYKGNLDDFIKKFFKDLVDLPLVNIRITRNVLSYMILGKLCDHTSMYSLVESLAMSTEGTENPTVTLNRLQNYAKHLGSKQKDSVEENPSTNLLMNSSSHPSKLVYYSANGVHNPLNTTHNPTSVTSSGINNQETLIIVNIAATHHMFSNRLMFTNLKESFAFIFSTGDPTSNLFSKGAGSVNVLIEGKTIILDNCILVPKISHNLISFLELFKSSITIEKLSSEIFFIKKSNEEILSGKISNQLMTVLNQPERKTLVTKHALFIEDNFHFLDEANNTDCSGWAYTGDEANVFFDCNESAVDYSYVESSPLKVHETVAQESPSPSVAERPDQVIIPYNSWRIRVICPQHPTLIRGDVDQTNILPFPCIPKALIIIEDDDPFSYSKAVSGWDNSPSWVASIEKQLKMMKDLKVWDFVKLEPHYKLVETTWLLKRKNKISAAQTEYKAQLCSQGFAQIFGKEYSKTSAPTGRMNTLRILIAFSLTNSLRFQKLDIQSEFLNAKLGEDVYLGILQGLNFNKKTHCIKLKKEIYGLKQAPLSWYNMLTAWLIDVGFTSFSTYPCVFYCLTGSPTWLMFDVDNIAVYGREVDPFKDQSEAEFDVKDMGYVKLMLGI
ncbi:hypothetical protein O181_006604 [Austropuccinia psidii MF-1]|uniref:Reverse transcriptase Ty1/copia-type domain-containing protein n=1 Tax=Austropuccinia psidii MF-1 TaxID=1389203 RepID=A0A9Q3BJJ0_9BASI|nr:hypothetical protein [Austropuccinia psidii MF-1]